MLRIEKGIDKVVKTIRVLIPDQPGYLGRVATAVGDAGANITDTHVVSYGVERNTRDITVLLDDEAHLGTVLAEIGRVEGVVISEIIDPVLELHRGGKIQVKSRFPVEGIATVRKLYTPGVAKVCQLIEQDPELRYRYTSIGNTVAIVTNGTAVLGLGDIGPVAGMPVMEGKAVLFDTLVGINGVPILVDSKDTDDIVRTVKLIAPSFGAIKLEDIKAPECFDIESQLEAALDIPVMHDDQHGTATVVLAALLNATKYVGKPLRNGCVGMVGLGAAGLGIAKLLMAHGVGCMKGTDINPRAIEHFARAGGQPLSLAELMKTADVVVCVTGQAGLLSAAMIRKGQIILALSNPRPEISPEEARGAGAAFAADGRSVNNALAFPGIFRGALSARARRICNRMKIAAARTIASFAASGELVPSILDPNVHKAVAQAVERAAFEAGVAQPRVDDVPEG